MAGDNNKKSSIINFRLTPKREQLIKELGKIDGFEKYKRKIKGKNEYQADLSQIFDILAEKAVKNPELFTESLIDGELNTFQLITELRSGMVKSTNQLGDIMRGFDQRMEVIENMLKIISKDVKRVASNTKDEEPIREPNSPTF